MKKFDVVIVGGAVTGSMLALALSSASQHKLRIAIIEKSLPDYTQQGGFDARSIALAHGSLQKIATITPLAFPTRGQLSVEICNIATPIEQIHISDQTHFGKVTLSANELHLTELGRVVELAKLGDLLGQCLAQQANIQIFCPDSVAQLQRTVEQISLTLTSGETLECALLIAADGIQSHIAEQCGIKTQTLHDYQQSAIIANVQLAEPHQNHAFERFTPQGPFALLPLTENTMSLVWCVNDPTIPLAMSDEAFLAALQTQFGWKLGKFKQVSKRFVYPLLSQKAESHIHHRLAIVGNAAQLLHPVAGQGFNLGIRDLDELANLVGSAFNERKDIGSFALLNQFEKSRNADQAKMISLTQGLVSLFSCEFLPAQVARNMGLMALNHCRLGRSQAAHQALGW